MMNESLSRKRRLSTLGWVSALLMIPATLAWLVNVEQAIRVWVPHWSVLEPLLPSAVFSFFDHFTADLSTVSTLVVVLLVLFPLVMARRVLLYAQHNRARLHRLIYDPYPPHFPFFLVMLGLVGTLYGLLIGLDVSGVSKLGASVSSPETIQQTLDQLLDGTATALLSSLWGLVGAFAAARPLTWLFYWAACLPKEEEQVRLTDALQRVIGDLQTLGEASRAFGERLDQTRVEDVPTLLAGLRDELALVQQRMEALGQAQTISHDLLKSLSVLPALETSLGRLGELISSGHAQTMDLQRKAIEQQAQAAQDALNERQKIAQGLRALEQHMQAQYEQAERGHALLSKLADLQREQLDSIAGANTAAEAHRRQIVDLLSAGARDRETDRAAVRQAFRHFIESEAGDRADTSS